MWLFNEQIYTLEGDWGRLMLWPTGILPHDILTKIEAQLEHHWTHTAPSLPSGPLVAGERIRWLRRQRGWTLEKLSECSGIAVPDLSNLESGRHGLGKKRALKLSIALGVGFRELL